ncbi:hypothetical protein TIFTF001_032243 [Ficus carica]|uniref:Uncharacterized protein n=1 Tax=Ficus carica TaxID=3494 RepID=A0AA88DWU4_FICCA|nr:hypothetical protein TIFTF001_032243 [Ficus carica]
MRGDYETGDCELPYDYFSWTPRYDYLSYKSELLHHGTVSLSTTGEAKAEGHEVGYLDFLP